MFFVSCKLSVNEKTYFLPCEHWHLLPVPQVRLPAKNILSKGLEIIRADTY